MGRAARNLNGEVIMYADRITQSMQRTIDATENRRSRQLAYNEAHGITPQAIVKARQAIVGLDKRIDEETTAARTARVQAKGSAKERAKRKEAAVNVPYAEEYSTPSGNIAADPVVAYMNADELSRHINHTRAEMLRAAKDMDFIEAARLRDAIIKMEQRLEKMK